MTTTPTLTGQDIGRAERATRAVLDRLLAKTGTTFHQWVTLRLLAANGGVLQRALLTRRMTESLRIAEPAVLATRDELVTRGFVTATPPESKRVELTPAGSTRYRDVRDGIDRITERLYGSLTTEELATAHRVLAIVTERANAELAR